MKEQPVNGPDSRTAKDPKYSILVPGETLGRAAEYLEEMRKGRATPGLRFGARLTMVDVTTITATDFLGELFDTKVPQIFAESAVSGDGSDWNLTELGLLGDVSVAAPVTIYDDGNHDSPTPHDPPFQGTLVFTPGALLRNERGLTPADWNEVTLPDGSISVDGYYGLYRRRLAPIFHWINERAARPRSALVTIPGLGCGQFAGKFRGRLGSLLKQVLERLLLEHGIEWPNLKAVHFDPYLECTPARSETNGISLLVRPLRDPDARYKPQLCRPIAYAEPGDDFATCSLFSLVAWDHVSWPGNDFYTGARVTDDGVKAAATSSMFVFTGVEGAYDRALGQYRPPERFRDWRSVAHEGIQSRGLRLWDPAAVWLSGSSGPPARD